MGFLGLLFPWGDPPGDGAGAFHPASPGQRLALDHHLLYANSGEPEQAEALFTEATNRSTLSETYLNYATFLASQNRIADAREWAQRLLARKSTIPRYLQRRERPWFRKAAALLKRLG